MLQVKLPSWVWFKTCQASKVCHQAQSSGVAKWPRNQLSIECKTFACTVPRPALNTCLPYRAANRVSQQTCQLRRALDFLRPSVSATFLGGIWSSVGRNKYLNSVSGWRERGTIGQQQNMLPCRHDHTENDGLGCCCEAHPAHQDKTASQLQENLSSKASWAQTTSPLRLSTAVDARLWLQSNPRGCVEETLADILRIVPPAQEAANPRL